MFEVRLNKDYIETQYINKGNISRLRLISTHDTIEDASICAETGEHIIWDTENEKAVEPEPLLWKDRNKICEPKAAIAILVRELLAVRQLYGKARRKHLTEMESFAKKHEIPFSAELQLQFAEKIDEVGGWDSSSCF